MKLTDQQINLLEWIKEEKQLHLQKTGSELSKSMFEDSQILEVEGYVEIVDKSRDHYLVKAKEV